MTSFLLTINHFGLRLGTLVLLLLPVAYALLLLWQDWRFRELLPRPAPPVSVPAFTPALADAALDATAVAGVLGLIAPTEIRSSNEPLTLQASFVASEGSSRALLADAGGSRMYQVGERLPGGSMLRRVDTDQVVLWRNGREERLALQPPAARFLHPLQLPADAMTPAVSPRYLRPIVEPSE